MMSEFVFCTGQYDSGDWDSAPLVPANIIDTIARYTEINVRSFLTCAWAKTTSGVR